MRLPAVIVILLLMCSSAAFAEELVLGSRGDEVIGVQNRLIELGYLTGEADGQYGAATARAIELFQACNGLYVTGTVNRQTRSRLFSEDALTDEVVAAQNRLIDLEYLSGKADGIWGAESERALRHFQRVNGLEQSGELDEVTAAVLMSDAALRDPVMAAQKKLAALGYYGGEEDGMENPETAEALKLFQELNGLDITGALDEETLRLLEKAEKYETLQTGSSGGQVTALQEKLIQLGFLEGAADGEYGKKTREAVLEFQNYLLRQGMTDVAADGTADSLTQEYLFSDHLPMDVKELSAGDSDDDVKRIERRLVNLGYMDAAADDTLDSYAAECLSAFQEAEGLEITGGVNQDTVSRIFSEGAALAEGFVPHEIVSGDTGEAVRQVQKILTQYGMYTGSENGIYSAELETALTRWHEYLLEIQSEYAAAFSEKSRVDEYAQELLSGEELLVIEEGVQSGAEGESVKRIQRRLYSLYYLAAYQIDGQYGAATQAAIEAFQRSNSLTETGVADEATQKALFSADALGNWTPYKLEIRISEQRVYVYQWSDENGYEAINSFICSTGLGDSTPTGRFLNTGPMNVWHYFEKFECWARYSYLIDGDILFHSVLYREKDTDSLVDSSVRALGSKASHGCVRLQVEDARWIYNHCEKGTIIEIRQ